MPAHVSPHFTVDELTKGRGWAVPVESERRYTRLMLTVVEPLRAAASLACGEDCPLEVVSGERTLGHNRTGRKSSRHLPPAQRADPKHREESAAVDLRPKNKRLSTAALFRIANEMQLHAVIPFGGLFWYPGRGKAGPYMHIDDRGRVAREPDKLPPPEAP